jgi:hypothetical protein
MAVRRSFSATIKNQTYRSDGNTLKNSTNYNFPIQSTPPLSFQQYARSITTLPGAQQWQSPGIYQPPHFHSYLSPEIRKKPRIPVVQPWIYSYRRKYSLPSYTLKNYKDIKPKLSEPIWRPPGHYIDKRPTSLSPEKRPQKSIHESIWHPPGIPQYKPVPYFDPPNLRWSLQQLLKSMPDLRPKTRHTSKSVSVIKSQ